MKPSKLSEYFLDPRKPSTSAEYFKELLFELTEEFHRGSAISVDLFITRPPEEKN